MSFRSRSLGLLLRIRQAQEDDSRRLMEGMIAERNRLESFLLSAIRRQNIGRGCLAAGVISGNAADRFAGQEEIRAMARLKAILMQRIRQAEEQVGAARQEFLERRMERRQVKTLLESLEEEEAVDERRREQEVLDEWHRTRDKGRSSHADAARETLQP